MQISPLLHKWYICVPNTEWISNQNIDELQKYESVLQMQILKHIQSNLCKPAFLTKNNI